MVDGWLIVAGLGQAGVFILCLVVRDIRREQHPLREVFLRAGGAPSRTNLSYREQYPLVEVCLPRVGAPSECHEPPNCSCMRPNLSTTEGNTSRLGTKRCLNVPGEHQAGTIQEGYVPAMENTSRLGTKRCLNVPIVHYSGISAEGHQAVSGHPPHLGLRAVQI